MDEPTAPRGLVWTARKRRQFALFLAVTMAPAFVLFAILGAPVVLLVFVALTVIPNVWLLLWFVNRRLRRMPPDSRHS